MLTEIRSECKSVRRHIQNVKIDSEEIRSFFENAVMAIDLIEQRIGLLKTGSEYDAWCISNVADSRFIKILINTLESKDANVIKAKEGLMWLMSGRIGQFYLED